MSTIASYNFCMGMYNNVKGSPRGTSAEVARGIAPAPDDVIMTSALTLPSAVISRLC